MASAEEVHALKREVELLKQMLEQEQLRGGAGGELSARSPGSSRLPSPTKSEQQQELFFEASRPPDDEYRREPTPRRPATAATSPSRVKTIRWKDAPSPHQPPQYQPAPSTNYTQFIAVDTKCGKWWLKDRQILSRNVPAPNDHTVAMKVRETWQWSGRTVVVDKIVTGPRPRAHDYEGDYGERDGDHRVQDLQDEAARYREELRRIGTKRTSATPATAPLSSITVAAQVAFHDSRQLAKEFIQPKSESNAADDEVSGTMRTASQRMEAEMAKAVAAVSEPGVDEGAGPPGELATRGGASESKPQTAPTKTAEESRQSPLTSGSSL